MITPSISQRGQRAHENLSRGRRRSEKQNKNDYSARHANRHLSQRLGERKTKKQKTNYNTRHAGIRLAQRLKIQEKPDYNTRHRSDLRRKKRKKKSL